MCKHACHQRTSVTTSYSNRQSTSLPQLIPRTFIMMLKVYGVGVTTPTLILTNQCNWRGNYSVTMTPFSHHNYRVNKLPQLTVRLLLLFYGGVVTTITAARHGWAISIGSITLLGKRAPVMLSFCWTKIAVARWRACKQGCNGDSVGRSDY